jgi:hypothetical protein
MNISNRIRSCARVALVFGMLVGYAQAQSTSSTPADKKPNIVLVLMDNLGWGEPGVYGGGILRGAPTPRIDHLAAEGMRLLNFNVEAQCTPSRAALMTGRYAIRTGNGSVPIETPVYGLVQWEVTMAEMLSDAGYATGMFGKWHLGHTEGRYPTYQGFDEWYGIPNSTDEAFWPDNARFRPDSNPYARPEYIMEGRKGEAPKDVRIYNLAERRTMDTELTKRAIDFMGRQTKANKPFFAYVPFTQPHMPTIPHQSFRTKPTTAILPTFSPKWTRTSVSCSMRSTSLESATTRSSSSRPIMGPSLWQRTMVSAGHGTAHTSQPGKAHCAYLSLCGGRAKCLLAPSTMRSCMKLICSLRSRGSLAEKSPTTESSTESIRLTFSSGKRKNPTANPWLFMWVTNFAE